MLAMAKRPQGDWSHWLCKHSMQSTHTRMIRLFSVFFWLPFMLLWPLRYSHSEEKSFHVFFSLSSFFLYFSCRRHWHRIRKSPKSRLGPSQEIRWGRAHGMTTERWMMRAVHRKRDTATAETVSFLYVSILFPYIRHTSQKRLKDSYELHIYRYWTGRKDLMGFFLVFFSHVIYFLLIFFCVVFVVVSSFLIVIHPVNMGFFFYRFVRLRLGILWRCTFTNDSTNWSILQRSMYIFSSLNTRYTHTHIKKEKYITVLYY